MDKITQLKQDLTKLDGNKADIENQIQAEYNKIFEDNSYLHTAIGELNRSNEYGMVDEEVFAWVRFYGSKFEDCREYLNNWLSDQSIVMDWENDALMLMQGGCLIIASNGDVYDTDSRKTVVETSQYTVDGIQDITKRNQLIEGWMETTGYYPGVFKTDDHGNVFAVNTTEK